MDNEVIYHCTHCPVEFGARRLYFRHMNNNHRGRIFMCNTCFTMHKGDKSWSTHSTMEHNGKAIPTCYFTGPTNLPRIKHWGSRRKGKSYPCPSCGEEVSSSWEMYLHKEEFHSGRIFVCEDCKEEFKSHTDLPAHDLNSHKGNAIFKVRYPNHQVNEFVCKVCDKVVEKSYSEHHQQHHGQTRFLCNHCGFFALDLKEKIRHKEEDGYCKTYTGFMNSMIEIPRPIDLAESPAPTSAQDRMQLPTESESDDYSDIFRVEQETPDYSSILVDSTSPYPFGFSDRSASTPFNPNPTSPTTNDSSRTSVIDSSISTTSTTSTESPFNPKPASPTTHDSPTTVSTSSENEVETPTIIHSKKTFSRPRPADDGGNVVRKIAFMLGKSRKRLRSLGSLDEKSTNISTHLRGWDGKWRIKGSSKIFKSKHPLVAWPSGQDTPTCVSTNGDNEVETPAKIHSSCPAENEVETPTIIPRLADVDGNVSRKITYMVGKNVKEAQYIRGLNGIWQLKKQHDSANNLVDLQMPVGLEAEQCSEIPQSKSPPSGRVLRMKTKMYASTAEFLQRDSAKNLVDLQMVVGLEAESVTQFASACESFDEDEEQYDSRYNISSKPLPIPDLKEEGNDDPINNMIKTEPNDEFKPNLTSSDITPNDIKESDDICNSIIKKEHNDLSCSILSSNSVNDSAFIRNSFSKSTNRNNRTLNSSPNINARNDATANNLDNILYDDDNDNDDGDNNALAAKETSINSYSATTNNEHKDKSYRENIVIPPRDRQRPFENANTWSKDLGASSSSCSSSFNTDSRPETPKVSCCICFLTFPMNSESYRLHLVDHIQDYEGESICPVCFVDCTGFDKMGDHFLMVHGKVRKLVCGHPTCVKSFRTRKDLDLHATIHQLH